MCMLSLLVPNCRFCVQRIPSMNCLQECGFVFCYEHILCMYNASVQCILVGMDLMPCTGSTDNVLVVRT